MEHLIFYTVSLTRFDVSGGQAMDRVKTQIVNEFHYHKLENAIHHLRAFLDVRPKSENWVPYHNNMETSQVYTYVNGYTTYEAALKCRSLTFND